MTIFVAKINEVSDLGVVLQWAQLIKGLKARETRED